MVLKSASSSSGQQTLPYLDTTFISIAVAVLNLMGIDDSKKHVYKFLNKECVDSYKKLQLLKMLIAMKSKKMRLFFIICTKFDYFTIQILTDYFNTFFFIL